MSYISLGANCSGIGKSGIVNRNLSPGASWPVIGSNSARSAFILLAFSARISSIVCCSTEITTDAVEYS